MVAHGDADANRYQHPSLDIKARCCCGSRSLAFDSVEKIKSAVYDFGFPFKVLAAD